MKWSRGYLKTRFGEADIPSNQDFSDLIDSSNPST